jgi:hypothetical protein
MASQPKDPQTLKSLAGSVLVGPGLFYLFGHLVWAADQLNRLLGDSAGEGMLSCVMLASSFGHQQVLHALIRIFWPLLLVASGAAFLWAGSTDQGNRPAGA